MITTACVYSLPSPERATHDGLRVLVMRHWPRGIAWSQVDIWIPSAAPSADLLAAYRAGRISWEAFADAYRTEQMTTQGCTVLVPAQQQQTKQRSVTVCVPTFRPLELLSWFELVCGTITLLCVEQDGLPCHRHELQRLLEAEKGAAERGVTYA
ncbi:MAG: DUF488 family protein [Ktedonobacteraceae bacterium]|nr:DUF488 family protein [Ktedonobacteraceae bacterium]